MSAPASATFRPGAVIARTLTTYRDNLGPLLTVPATAFIPLGLLAFAASRVAYVGLGATTAISLAGMFFVQGALVWSVARMRADAGRPPPLGATLRAGRGWFVPVAVASIIASASVIAGLILLIVPGLVLLTWWVVLPAVVVIERCGVRRSFGRSRALVSGNGMQVFQVAVITMAIQLALSLALGLATAPLGEVAADIIGLTLGNTLAAPLVAVAWTLTYFDLVAIEQLAHSTAGEL